MSLLVFLFVFLSLSNIALSQRPRVVKKIYNLFGAFLLSRFHYGPLSTLISSTVTEEKEIKIKDEIESFLSFNSYNVKLMDFLHPLDNRRK